MRNKLVTEGSGKYNGSCQGPGHGENAWLNGHTISVTQDE